MNVARSIAFGLTVASCASAKTIDVKNIKTEDIPYPLQTAIDVARPGDTIVMEPGLYFEDIQSSRDGLLSAPITIKGPASAVIRGESGERIVLINHDHIHLEGFSVNGVGDQDQEDEHDPERYHDHLIHVHGNRMRSVEYSDHTHRSGVMGFKATKLHLSHAGSTCIKMSYFVTHAELTDNDIINCGAAETLCVDDINGCGRGLDLGTSLPQRMEGLGGEVDESAWNSIKGNSFSSIGGACLIVHEGARTNLIDSNTCVGSKDYEGAGMILRGDANIFRYNSITGASGAGVGLGGAKADSHKYGIFNQVFHNQLGSNERGSLLDSYLPEPSGMVCLNAVDKDAPDMLAQECPRNVNAKPDHGEEYSHDSVQNKQTVAGSSDASGVSPGLDGNTGGAGQRETSPSSYRCIPFPLEDKHLTSSVSEGTENQGNEPGLVVDNESDTHWSRYGMGQWIEFNLESASGDPTLEAALIQFYDGDSRVQYFQITADGEEVVTEGASSGKKMSPELFMFEGGGVKADKIRFIGQGNQPTGASAEFSKWNTISKITLCQGPPNGASK